MEKIENILDNISLIYKRSEHIEQIIKNMEPQPNPQPQQTPININCQNNDGTANPDCFQFSDHLPVIRDLEIEGTTLRFASWNVLFQTYLNYFIDPTKHIGKYFPHLIPTNMSEQNRMMEVFNIIVDLLKKYKVDILGLQEFDKNKVQDLQTKLDNNGLNYIKIITSDDLNINKSSTYKKLNPQSQDVQIILYNSNKVKHNVNKSHIYEAYTKINTQQSSPNKRILNTSFTINNHTNQSQEFRVVNTHVEFKRIDDLNAYIFGGTNSNDVILNGIGKPKNYPGAFNIVYMADFNKVVNNDPVDVLVNHNKQNVLINSNYSHLDTFGKPVLYDNILLIKK